jgi:dynein intermediate chain
MSLFSARDLSDDEKRMIVLSEEFQKFFDKSSRVIERVLAEDVDVFVDYASDKERDTDG